MILTLALDGTALFMLLLSLGTGLLYSRLPEVAIAGVLITICVTISLYDELIASFLRSV